jgi:MFS family permease
LLTSLNQLMLLRLIAGFGIGGVLGIVTALVSEFAPRRIRGTMVVMGEYSPRSPDVASLIRATDARA